MEADRSQTAQLSAVESRYRQNDQGKKEKNPLKMKQNPVNENLLQRGSRSRKGGEEVAPKTILPFVLKKGKKNGEKPNKKAENGRWQKEGVQPVNYAAYSSRYCSHQACTHKIKEFSVIFEKNLAYF